MEEWRRREILIVGLGLLLPGSCGGGSRVRPSPPEAPSNAPAPAESPPASPSAELPEVGEPLPEPLSILDRVYPRSAWTDRAVDARRARPMNGVRRITVHHSGSERIGNDAGFVANAALIEKIRAFHVEGRGWADIGYHFLIDPGGRVWEGRPLAWQGAHVRGFNERNIGVVCLGNFDLQQPSLQQLMVLPQVVRALRRKYGVRLENLRSHQEWAPTACPGKNLQPRFEHMRATGQLA